jgi:hypothetical protein
MVHTLCSTLRADNTCKDTNFFLNIRKREAEKFAMAGFLVWHDSQKRLHRMHCHSKKFAIFAGRIALHAIFSGACSVVKT